MTRNKSFDKNSPLLYLVATPIGNLGEFSKRALEVVSEMDIIACEDTRNTQKLLNFFGIKKELFSLREHNESSAAKYIIDQIKSGKKVAYVSDAGYPCISDPGNILTKLAIEERVSISTVCGSSAFLNALVSSGLPTDHFYFYGFLSAKENEASNELLSLKDIKNTLIFYESPHRIKRTLELLFKVLGSRKFCIGRELTKLNEEFIRGNLSETGLIDESTLIGEMVIVVEGSTLVDTISDDQIKDRVNELIEMGVSKKTAIEIASQEFKINKNRIKDLFLK